MTRKAWFTKLEFALVATGILASSVSARFQGQQFWFARFWPENSYFHPVFVLMQRLMYVPDAAKTLVSSCFCLNFVTFGWTLAMPTWVEMLKFYPTSWDHHSLQIYETWCKNSLFFIFIFICNQCLMEPLQLNQLS